MNMRTPLPGLAAVALLLGAAHYVASQPADPDPLVSDAHEKLAQPARQATAGSVQLGASADVQETREWRDRRERFVNARIIGGDTRLRESPDIQVIAPELTPPEVTMTVSLIKGGIPTTSRLAVGMLLGGASMAKAYSQCTVTLTKPNTVLTARHCLDDTHNDTFWVYLPYGGVRKLNANSVKFFCNDNDPGCSPGTDDLAIATLETPFDFLPVANAGNAAIVSGTTDATVVGYGVSGADLADFGIKREGDVSLESCTRFANDGLSHCFAYVVPGDEGTGENSKVRLHANCSNDSGGPMLMRTAVKDFVVGVASQVTGRCDNSGEGRYVNATNPRYHAWFQSAFCDPQCVPASNIAMEQVLAEPINFLGVADSMKEHEFTIQGKIKTLIVTLNHGRGYFPDTNDLDLGLPSTLNAVCQEFIEVEVCTATAPAAGTFKATISRIKGSAEYQLSAVAISESS